MFVAGYWWKIHPGKEDQFRAAWRRGTELIRQNYGSFGSRLHRQDMPDGGVRFVGIAEWPDRACWQAAYDAKMVYDEPATRAIFVESVAESSDGPMFLLELTDDMLDHSQPWAEQ